MERPIRCIRKSFLYGRKFANDADLNEQAERWVERTSNGRRHRTTASARTAFSATSGVPCIPRLAHPINGSEPDLRSPRHCADSPAPMLSCGEMTPPERLCQGGSMTRIAVTRASDCAS